MRITKEKSVELEIGQIRLDPNNNSEYMILEINKEIVKIYLLKRKIFVNWSIGAAPVIRYDPLLI